MVKALQKRFVIVAMAAITGLILLLLGAINAANLMLISQRMDRTLELLCSADGDPGNLPPTDKPSGRPFPFGVPDGPRGGYSAFVSGSFFLVRFGPDNEPVFVDVSRAYSVSEDQAAELALKALEKGNKRGEYGHFRYLIREGPGPGALAVFLDTSGESGSFWRVLILSAAVGFFCWGIMLVFVILLSRRAIRPIAENIQRQKQFVTNAGHELKTPLAIIQSNAEALELYNGESKWSRNIREQTARLGGLVKELLMLARMDESPIQGEPENFSLRGLIESSLREFSQPIAAKGLNLAADITADVSISADREQVRKLVSILLDNCVKYADPGGRARVTLVKGDSRIELSIENTCPKLPEVPPDKLFDRFYRADPARTQKGGGYGVGLAIARSLAGANRAAIWARYIQPNLVRFTVRFRQ